MMQDKAQEVLLGLLQNLQDPDLVAKRERHRMSTYSWPASSRQLTQCYPTL